MDNDGRMVVGSEKHKPYPSYKDSGVEGLREVPGHWAVRKVTQLFSIGSGTTPPTDYSEYYGGKIPWITTSELRESVVTSTEQTVTKQALETFPALNVYPEGSVAVAMYGATIGRLGVLGTPAAVNQACCVFSVPQRIDAWFWFYWLQSRRPYLISLGYGGGQPNLSQELLKSIRVPTPLLDEQRAITAFLDRETAKIDALVAKKERLIELLQEKRTALITRAVTKGLDPDVRMKDSGVEWLGKIPDHWEIAPVYARYEVALGKMLDAKRIGGNELGRYLRNVDVQWDSVNTHDLPQMDFAPEERDRYRLSKGDLLVCEGGEVGRAAIWDGSIKECFYQKAIHRVRPRSMRDIARFFYYIMYALAMRGVFVAGSNPNTINHLTAVQLSHYRFPFPPSDEQSVIAAFLDRETAKINALLAKIHEAVDRLKELRTALISAAVTGKIDVRPDAGQLPGTAS